MAKKMLTQRIWTLDSKKDKAYHKAVWVPCHGIGKAIMRTMNLFKIVCIVIEEHQIGFLIDDKKEEK